VTQLSNPKTAIAYACIFTTMLPAGPPAWIAWVILPMIFLIETGWYAIVALVFSSEEPRRRYLGGKVWLDRLAAGIIGLLGAKLISEAK
jgi:threonine/homoserine/homoserine lactone efflux protein